MGFFVYICAGERWLIEHFLNIDIMKKQVSKMALVVFVGLAMLMFATSCNEKGTVELTGTSWRWDDPLSDEVGTLKFEAKTFTLQYTETEDGRPEIDTYKGTYQYNHPTITFKYQDENEKETERGRVDGNKIVLDGEEIFIRQ